MINVLSESNSLVLSWINEMRNTAVQTDRMRFRRNLQRMGEVVAYEISKHLDYEAKTIQTPLAQTQVKELKMQPVITSILRAGVPLFEGLLNYFDHADCGFVAAYRKHDANDYFSIKQDYLTCPNFDARPLIVADSMLATGASLIEAIKELLKHGTPSQLHIVSVIASTEGIKKLSEHFPQAHLWIGAEDSELTPRGYILPGLGDAGDLSYGEKLQY